MPASVHGLDDLNRKLRLIKANFDGPPINKLVLQGARDIRDEARGNLRGNLTGRLRQAVEAIAGRRASKQGAAAIARVNAWRAPHAYLVAQGTKDRTPGPWQAMKIPFGKFFSWQSGGMAMTKGGRFKKGAAMVAHWSAVFFRHVRGAKGSHFWERALDAQVPKVQRNIEDGCRKIVEESIK